MSTIKEQLTGKWENLKDATISMSFKVDDVKIMEKWSWNVTYNSMNFGEKTSDGTGYILEENKMIRRKIDEKGEEAFREEYFMKNGQLVEAYFEKGELVSKSTFKRIGEPEPEP